MSEEDNKKSGGSGGSVVMVDKSASSRHKPYRPTELQDEPVPDLHKRSKAPAVPSLADELKDITVSETADHRDRIECDRTVSSDKHTHAVKNQSSTNKRQGSTAEDIAMDTLEVTKDNLSPAPPQPIPAHIETVVSKISVADSKEKAEEKTDLEKTARADDDSITEEITELRTADAVVKDHSEWSDDEEAGGLPRSESRGSRVSRVVRQLFCCGVAYTAPSEEDIPAREYSAI